MISTSTTNIIASSAAADVVASSPAVATAVRQLPPMGEEIFDIAGTVNMPYPWLAFFWQILLFALGLCLVIWFFRWLTAPVERIRKPIIQSPEVQAARAIKRMKLSEFWYNRNIKAVCENTAAILKNYALDAYKLSFGAAATSDEFIPALIKRKTKNEVLAGIKDLLGYCDEIRYTGREPREKTQEDLVELLEKLINTKEWCK